MTVASCIDASHSAIKDFCNLSVRAVRLERDLLQLEQFQKLKNGLTRHNAKSQTYLNNSINMKAHHKLWYIAY